MDESSETSQQPDLSGWLYKWTNYLRGYQKRWFVLSDGYLCYYRNQLEMNHTCRGTLSLQGATIYSEESNNFIVSNGETYHLKAQSVVDKRKWVDALLSARSVASTHAAPNTITDSSITALADDLKRTLEDVKNCNALINSQGHALNQSLSELETLLPTDGMTTKKIEIREKLNIFRSLTSSMITACSNYLDLAERHHDKWVTLIQNEKPQMIQSMRVVQSMTNCKGLGSSSGRECFDEETAEYFDCEDSASIVEHSKTTAVKARVHVFQAMVSSSKDKGSDQKLVPSTVRRTRIPDRPKVSANLWNIIKNAVGKDLTKIPVPVNFSEPLSLLQRLTEDFEYAHQILDKANSSVDPGEQMAYVASFAVSSYSTTINRSGKPFNPLLGETYECDRTSDLGWRSIAEQVSHHPPIAALHCEGKNWECWQEQSMNTRFRGHYLQIIPLGEVHLKLKNRNAHYAWKKAITNVHNIIIGKLWIDQEGDVEIKCFTNGYSCTLNFLSPGYFSGDPHKLKGVVKNEKGTPMFDINGGYDSKIELSAVKENSKATKSGVPKQDVKVIWERVMPPVDSDRYYNFTVFACQLNEMEPGVAPTDTRNRPDQRFMEEGKFDLANSKKEELEEFQRATRKKMQDNNPGAKSANSSEFWRPTWFSKERDTDTHTEMFVYKGDYWQCKQKKDWSRCPKIYGTGK